MRSILELRKLDKSNHRRRELDLDEETAFVLVDASTKNMGAILMVNDPFLQLIKMKRDDTIHLTIKSIMPRPISSVHDRFLKAFQHRGDSQILNMNRVQFMVDSNFHLIPAHIFMRLHYSTHYGYCFFSSAKPITKMRPFKTGIDYLSSNLCFLAFNLEDGNVTEYSGNFLELLKEA